MLRNKVVWDKHYYSNRFTVRNIFLLRYSRFRLMCTFNHDFNELVVWSKIWEVTFDPDKTELLCIGKKYERF